MLRCFQKRDLTQCDMKTRVYVMNVWLLIIIVNTRGQIENRPLENSCRAGRKWLQAGCKCIYGTAADWSLDHHPMDFNQSGDFVTCCICAVPFEVNAVYR